jgi:urease accessory protein
MRMGIEATQLLLLLNWMSPAFPIGSFAYSHGLEQVIASGDVANAENLEAWIGDVISHGSAHTDAVLFARCWHDDAATLNALALALAGSAERYQETVALGRNFSVAAQVWHSVEFPGGDLAYPIAAGLTCRAAGIDCHSALLAFVQGFCASMVSVAVRLVPLGQTRGLQVLRNLSSGIEAAAEQAHGASQDDIGSNCLLAEIAAMKHEYSSPRVFRT